MKRKSENAFGWATAAMTIGLVSVLQGYLASKHSLWSDELAAIDPAVSPWVGGRSFWFLIKQYIANPPGENLVLRWLYNSSNFAWLRQASLELFWRLPYLFAYALSAVVTYSYALKWSRSPLVASTLLALFLSSPGPFAWATETRFYAWAILFMTCAVWEGVLFIEGGFDRKSYCRLSFIAAIGVLFHVSLALICDLLFGYALFLVGSSIYKWKRTGSRPTRGGLCRLVLATMIGTIPHIIYQYEKIHWIYVPNGTGIWSVFGSSLSQAAGIISSRTAGIMPFGKVWRNGGWVSFSMGFAFVFALAVRARDLRRALVSFFILALAIGGPFALILSSNANRFAVLDRHFLFVVPVLICGSAYLVYDRIREKVLRIPPLIRCFGIFLVLTIALGNGIALTRKSVERGSPAKVNADLARFRDFYSMLPDRKKLVLVGVGSGEPLLTDDVGEWIGGAHTFYAAEYSPFFLNSREAPKWKIPTQPSEWAKYEFLIFVPSGKEPEVEGLAWDRLRCSAFSWGRLRFCR